MYDRHKKLREAGLKRVEGVKYGWTAPSSKFP
jgi:hypothetical protein